jgi:hypothetical protein
MEVPNVPPGGGEGSGPTNQAGGPSPFPAMTGAAGDAWLKFAQQLFPSAENPGQYVAPLKKNMMSMINNTISEINTRHKIANEYIQKVAKGEE